MFRRIYAHVAWMLIATSVCLLAAVGLAVYGQSRLLQIRAGETTLREAVPEIQEVFPKNTAVATMRMRTVKLSDDVNPNICFYVTQWGRLIVRSERHPVPLAVFLSVSRRDGFQTFTYQGVPYRVYRTQIAVGQAKDDPVFVYTKIDAEREVLRRLAHVVAEIGGLAALVSAGINLWLAHRAIRPARETWRVYQEMVATLSHELQTPLATIQAIASVPSIDAATRKALSREIDQASQMVRDILYLSRLRAKLPERDPEPVAVSDLTEEVAGRFCELAQSRTLTLNGRAEPGLYVLAVPEAWTRMVSTLLKNVIDHADEGSQATWELSATEGEVVFRTTNRATRSTGEIPDRGSWEEADPNHTPVKGGYGLRIVDRLVAEMDGRWSLEKHGDDVVVTVRMPRLTHARTRWLRRQLH